MVKRLSLILFISTLLPSFIWGQNLIEFIEFGFEIYQYIEKEGNRYAKSEEWLNSEMRREMIMHQKIKPRIERQLDASLLEFYQTCPGCPDVLPLAEDINDIVQVLAEREDPNNPEAHLLEEVGELEMVVTVSRHLSEPLGGGGCYTEAFCYQKREWSPLIDNSMVLAFSGPIDFEELNGIQLRTDGRREYYYRAELPGLEDEAIIHLVVEADGSRYLEYYSKKRHDQSSPPAEGTPQPPEERFRSGRPDDVYGPWFGFNNMSANGHFRGHLTLGVELPSGGGFPERFHLLDLQAKQGNHEERLRINSDGSEIYYRFNREGFDLQAGAETNYNTFGATFGLPEYALLNISTNTEFDEYTAELRVPLDIRRENFSAKGDTTVSHTIGEPTVDLETNYVFNFRPATLFSIEMGSSTTFEPANSRVNSIDIGSNLELSPDATFSLMFAYEHQESPSFTFRYNLRK